MKIKPVKMWALVNGNGDITQSGLRIWVLLTRKVARSNRNSHERIAHVLITEIPRKKVKA